jgi:hypothetical protein
VCRYCSWRALGHALVALDGGMGRGGGGRGEQRGRVKSSVVGPAPLKIEKRKRKRKHQLLGHLLTTGLNGGKD